jgi:hypothetical protein
MRLLVNSSVLNAYAGRNEQRPNKVRAGAPNADTALLRFKTIDRYELQSLVFIVLEEQVGELKRRGLLNRPVPSPSTGTTRCFTARKYGDAQREAEGRLLLRRNPSAQNSFSVSSSGARNHSQVLQFGEPGDLPVEDFIRGQQAHARLGC